ncbi:MAG: hypothetical protein A3B99_02065 [Candidatus Yanofskybacteria bacterium RIFCSPHIGHO2_02_FULL_44_12b]|uniref:Glutamate--cysteine ligase n=2 Tax=Candidatus Yanofskyibacteriota TaxID=1752733 RepID=A0A1F8GR58_9BACT|nr:MAG: hypothetical protein UW79_C0012G0006 [Candidatus Yanofskybacteria bacterium GW2011_GWA2_44_9]OGN05188.1 MAG: hypothetical protein A2659_04140 [Candidatus Yanofskybacteria bacterium RIFCSPHIGHO2_01_FULL_44_24]OGN15247.1 MAG: hypothetical protein A3B99_02065 [Candidatus Yanofskybacteria bacterium RIFCSPHIGHO2_02_FULL_44_12b]OGN26909.1 MAG: hypothetical protein A2925_01400 [Candidatus Yanofskybacteria bacterium RIFCSPLOWO2_01_FULL_44_22]
MGLKEFLSKFRFKPELAGFVGIEREHFLVHAGGLAGGVHSPSAKRFLEAINDPRWTYELSAYQVESRTVPSMDLSAMRLGLLENENLGNRTATGLGLRLVNEEVAPFLSPLEVYPDPRYLKIAKTISPEKLDAASRVTGTHIHIGVGNIEKAIALNNVLIPRLNELCAMGDHSDGERLRLYRLMADNYQPTAYESSEHLFEIARAEGFTDNPRNCWKLIRISIHGTVELRMFGVTDNLDEILEWVSFVKKTARGGI